MKRLLMVGPVFLLAACGAGTPIATTNYTGVWEGSLTNGANGQSVPIRFSFVQSGSNITATLYGFYTATNQYAQTGRSDTESLNGNNLNLNIIAYDGTLAFSGTFNGNIYTGNQTGSVGGQSESGTFSVKQTSTTPIAAKN